MLSCCCQIVHFKLVSRKSTQLEKINFGEIQLNWRNQLTSFYVKSISVNWRFKLRPGPLLDQSVIVVVDQSVIIVVDQSVMVVVDKGVVVFTQWTKFGSAVAYHVSSRWWISPLVSSIMYILLRSQWACLINELSSVVAVNLLHCRRQCLRRGESVRGWTPSEDIHVQKSF